LLADQSACTINNTFPAEPRFHAAATDMVKQPHATAHGGAHASLTAADVRRVACAPHACLRQGLRRISRRWNSFAKPSGPQRVHYGNTRAVSYCMRAPSVAPWHIAGSCGIHASDRVLQWLHTVAATIMRTGLYVQRLACSLHACGDRFIMETAPSPSARTRRSVHQNCNTRASEAQHATCLKK
jgi:hypothetical protein